MAVGKSAFGFEADLKKFGATLGISVSKVRRKLAFSLHAKITQRTPVDTGRLRASWFMSDSAPSTQVAPVGAKGKGEVTATFANPYDRTFIVNNLPYAWAIEFGHSDKAPMGMVRVSLAEVEAGLLKALGDL